MFLLLGGFLWLSVYLPILMVSEGLEVFFPFSLSRGQAGLEKKEKKKIKGVLLV